MKNISVLWPAKRTARRDGGLGKRARAAMATMALLTAAGVRADVCVGAGQVTLAREGRPTAIVVVAEDAIEPEQHAAAELASFLGEVTGGRFELVRATAASPGHDGTARLLVGEGAARLAEAGFSVADLGQEGIILRTVGRDIILAGGRPRGTLYAVYSFLEDHVGCRWWSSKAATLPHQPTLAVGPLDVRYLPVFEFRDPYWFDAFDADWAVRNKSNGITTRLDDRRGGKMLPAGYVHTFYTLIPPGKYFADHPEWFSEIDGQRRHEHAQLCLSNEDMRRELVKNLRETLRLNPAATFASVSQNDWHGDCRCARCVAVNEEEGSPAGLLLRFVNAVAGDIEEEFPHVAVSTLAYQYTRTPPRHTRPSPGVIVQLCSIECSFSVPLVHERNQAFRDDLKNWSKICNRLYIWDYTTNFKHYVLPHPNLRVLGPNVRFFAEHNVRGVFEQGAYQSYGSEMAELRAWVLAKLLWDPSRDAKALINEFLEGYYGPAGRPIGAYLELIHDAVEASGDYLGCFSNADAAFLSFPTLARGVALMDEAERAVGKDEALRLRVRVARLPLMYVFLVHWYSFREEARLSGTPWPMPDTLRELYEEVLEIVRSGEVTRVSESAHLEPLQRLAEQPDRTRADPPPGCDKLPPSRWMDLQDYRFALARPEWAALAVDPAASDGAAARMPGDHHEWAVSVSLKHRLVAETAGSPLRCKLSVRCETTGKEGLAFTCGIYDWEHRQGVAHLAINAEQIPGDGYSTYDLGVHPLTERMQVWVAPSGNPEVVKAVWVDRVWLIHE